MLIAFFVAVLIALIVKLVLELFDIAKPYSDIVAIIVGILVFLGRAGVGL